jgi:mRNA interferase RelE/StbE
VRYIVVIMPAAARALALLPANVRRRIDARILSLANDPRPHDAKKLKGQGGDVYRFRVGDYRVIYLIDDRAKIVTVVKTGHRSDIYD